MNRIILPFFVLVLFLLTGCPRNTLENTGTLELNFELKVNGADGELNQKYQISSNRYLTLDSLRFYVSNVVAIKSDGSELPLLDVNLFDFDETGKTTHGSGIYKPFEVPVGEYKGLKFNLGLPSELNHSNPTLFNPTNHPLHSSRNTNWNITDGYLFLQVAGEADSLLSGGTPKRISYQLGTDNLLRPKNYSTASTHAFSIKPDRETQFILQIELTEILNGIDFLGIPVNHTRPQGSALYDDAVKMMDNFSTNSLYKVP